MTETPKKSLAWIFKTFFILAILGTVVGGVAVAGVAWHFSKDLPNIISVEDYKPLTVTRVIAAPGGTDKDKKEGTVIGEFAIERRFVIPYEKMPENVVRAFISAEDDQFFEHSGINLVSIIRASIANFRAGHLVQGGSTITQQIVKSLLLTKEKSFDRKIKEVILAYRIEKNLTKQQILYLYLNQIYLGHGAYGIQAAANVYFRKDVSELSIAEAALLAGMPQAPGKYSPLLNPKKAKERQLYVLRRMLENRYISQAQMAEAAAQALKIYHDEDITPKYAPYLVEHIRRYLVEKYGYDTVYKDGLTVFVPTTAEISLAAMKSVREGLETVDKRNGYRGPTQTLKTREEIENFLKEERENLVERKLQCKAFLPDGRLDSLEALKLAGLTSDSQLLEQGETYPAVVTNVDDAKKSVRVMIGAVAADLPFEKMKWARPARDEKNPGMPRPEPKVPSKVLKHGDVILARVVSTGEKGAVVSLEQEPEVQGAVFSVEAQTGYVLAMHGGYDYGKSEFNRAAQAMRQPGSAFKPFIFSAALEKGFTPASIIVDSPIVYEDSETGKWKPNNFEEKFYGDTTFRQALIHSRNVPTIKIVQAIQVPALIDYTKRIGLASQLNADLSISLGSGGVSLQEITKAYAIYPRLGRKLKPIFFTKIVDRDGKVLEEQKPQAPATLRPLPPAVATEDSSAGQPPASGGAPATEPTLTPVNAATGTRLVPLALPPYPLQDDPEQVVDPRVAFVMTHLMKEVVTYGTGHDAQKLERPAAGKTGTTSDYVDAWFVGFTPHVVTGAWVGYDSHKPIGPSETGAKAALPIWMGLMREAVKSYPDEDFQVPPGVVFASIDANSGKLASPNSLNSIKEAFIEGTQPTETAAKGSSAPSTATDFFKEDTE